MLASLIITLAALSAAQTPEEEPPRLTKNPELLELIEADYPPEALEQGIEATVGLWIDVDATGVVTAVEIFESAGVAFDEAAKAAALQFRFSPAEAEGIGPVPVRIRYRYRFILREERVRTSSTSTLAATSTAVDAPVGPINLSGTVLEAGSRAPVSFATIEAFIGETVTATDADRFGKFGLRGLPPGEHTLRISAPFFETIDVKEKVVFGEAAEVLYFLDRVERSPYEVVVRAQRPRKEVARRTLEMEEIRRIPGAQGDAIRVIQNLPGVARTPYGLGLLVVRGAPPQSTGVFVDGHRIPLLFHFGGVGGVTSVINSRILDQINFYPGGFGPEYGRLSAGAVELITRVAATDRVHGEAQIDFLTLVPVNVGVFIEGPVTSDPDDGAFVFSLRRSSIDGVLALLTEAVDSSVALAPRYYDYFVRYDRPLGSRKRMFSVSAYGSDDELVLVGADEIAPNTGGPAGTRSRTYFHRINPKFTYRGDDGSVFIVSPIAGVDFTDTAASGGGGGGDAFSLKIRNFNAGGRIDGTVPIDETFTLRTGAEILRFEFAGDSELPAFGSIKDFPSPIASDVPTERRTIRSPVLLATAYLELEIGLFDRLKIWPGLRLDMYDFQADPFPLLDPRLVEGRSQISLDPRLTARYQLNDDLALKGQAGQFHEPPLPPQFFLNADLPLQRADQFSLGFEWDIVEKLMLDVQGFYRLAVDVPRDVGDVEVVDGRVRQVGFLPEGEQRAYGLELMLKLDKRWGLFGWVAYTLSRSEFRRIDQEFRPNFFFDQTHNLNIVAVYELGLSWNVGMRFRYVTGGGRASTAARWYDADRDAYLRQIGDQVRGPSFHQLDLYVEKRWTFDQWYLEAYLDVQNVYNYENTELFAPSFDFKELIPIPGLPIFPAIGLRGVF